MSYLGSFTSKGQEFRRDALKSKEESRQRNLKANPKPEQVEIPQPPTPPKKDLAPLTQGGKTGVPVIRREGESYQDALNRSAQRTADYYARRNPNKEVSVTVSGSEREPLTTTQQQSSQNFSPYVPETTYSYDPRANAGMSESPTQTPAFVVNKQRDELQQASNRIFGVTTDRTGTYTEYKPEGVANTLAFKSGKAGDQALREGGLSTLRGAGATATAFSYGFASRGVSTAQFIGELGIKPIPTLIKTGNALTKQSTYDDMKTNIVTNPSGSAGAFSFDLAFGGATSKGYSVLKDKLTTPKITSQSELQTYRFTNLEDPAKSLDKSFQTTYFSANKKSFRSELSSRSSNVQTTINGDPYLITKESGSVNIFDKKGKQVSSTTFESSGSFIDEDGFVIGGTDYKINLGKKKTVSGRTSLFGEESLLESGKKANNFDYTSISREGKKQIAERGSTALIYAEDKPLVKYINDDLTLTTAKDKVKAQIYFTESKGQSFKPNKETITNPETVIFLTEKSQRMKPFSLDLTQSKASSLNTNQGVSTITTQTARPIVDPSVAKIVTEKAIKNAPTTKSVVNAKPVSVISATQTRGQTASAFVDQETYISGGLKNVQTEKPFAFQSTGQAQSLALENSLQIKQATAQSLFQSLALEKALETKQAQSLRQSQSLRLSTGQVLSQSLALEKALETKQATQTVQKQTGKLAFPIGTLTTTQRTVPFVSAPRNTPTTTSRAERFEAFSFRRGRLEKIGGVFSSKEEASKYARGVVGGSSRASFKVSRLGSRAPEQISEFGGSMFAPAKSGKRKGFLVERNRYRIDTGGERGEITFKGVAVSKARRQFKLF